MSEERVQGTLHSVAWRGPNQGRCILCVRGQDRQLFHAVCDAQPVYVGERVELLGYWSPHPRPAAVFHASRVESSPPADANGLIHFLGQALACDTVVASSIVAQFGDHTVEVLDETPHRLIEVPDLDEQAVSRMESAWLEARVQNRARSIMAAMNLSSSQAERIERLFGQDFDKLIEHLSRDPYLAYIHDETIDFKAVDRFAQTNGGNPSDDVRLCGLAVWIARRVNALGHTYVHRERLINRMSQMLRTQQLPVETLANAVSSLIERGVLAESGQRIYLPALKATEMACLRRLETLTHQDTSYESSLDWEGIGEILVGMGRSPIADHQRRLCEFALAYPVTLIDVQRAGDDDTAVVTLAHLMDALSIDCRITSIDAPHADRLNTLTDGLGAISLAECLGLDDENRPTYTPERPLETDCILVAHAEQLDIELFRILLDAIPDGCGLILIGDACCQTSMRPGHPYLDLLLTKRVPTHLGQSWASRENPAALIGMCWAGEYDRQELVDVLDEPVSALSCPDDAIGSLLDDLVDGVIPELGYTSCQLIMPSLAAAPDARTIRRWRDPERPDHPRNRSSGLRAGETAVLLHDISALRLRAGHQVRIESSTPPCQVRPMDPANAELGLLEIPADRTRQLFRDVVLTPPMIQGRQTEAVVLVLSTAVHPAQKNRSLFYTAACAATRHLFIVGDTQGFIEGLERERPRIDSGFAELINEESQEHSWPDVRQEA